MTVEFTNKSYKCPKCGREIDGYIEDEGDELAGCVNCLDFWNVRELKETTREKVEFT